MNAEQPSNGIKFTLTNAAYLEWKNSEIKQRRRGFLDKIWESFKFVSEGGAALLHPLNTAATTGQIHGETLSPRLQVHKFSMTRLKMWCCKKVAASVH